MSDGALLVCIFLGVVLVLVAIAVALSVLIVLCMEAVL